MIFWVNGRRSDSAFEMFIGLSINSLKRLKDAIIGHLKLSRQYIERTIIYNYKGLEVDDSDINYLNDGQVLYVSVDGNLSFT